MTAMSRTFQRWPVLLSALAFLLISALSKASPMYNGASSSSNSASSSSVRGEHYSAFTDSHPVAESVWLHNQVHYKSYPIFNTAIHPTPLIEAARKQFGAVWLIRPSYHPYFPTKLSLYPKDAGYSPVSRRDHDAIFKKVQKATELEQRIGPQARSIKYGHPFQPLLLSPTPSWDKVWGSRKEFYPAVPPNQESDRWPMIRERLQRRRSLVLVDYMGRRELGFRLNPFGKVEMFVRALAERIHKRSEPQDAILLDETGENIQDVNKSLAKRTFGSSSSYDSVPPFQSMEYILAHPQGLSIVSSLPPTRAEGLDLKYARVLHYGGFPVYDVHETDVQDLQQALVDYKHVYVYGTMRGARDKSVIQVFADKAPVISHDASRAVLEHVASSDQYKAVWGSQLHALAYGRPIQRHQGGPSDHHIFFVGNGHAYPNLFEMREALASSGSLEIRNKDTGNILKLTLDPEGLAKMARTFGPARLVHPRVIKPADTNSDRERGFSAHSRLAKRMRPESSDPIRPLEYYVAPNFHFRTTPALTPAQLDSYFANEIHYMGKPILFPNQVPESKVRHALGNHEKVWLVGRPSYSPNGPPQYVGLQHTREGLVMNSVGWEQVARHVDNVNEFGANHGEILRYLRYGRPFAPRTVPGLFSRYKVPSWDKVRSEGTLFHLIGTTDVSRLHQHLDAHNYLTAYNNEQRKLYGFALNKEGNVLFHDFGQVRL